MTTPSSSPETLRLADPTRPDWRDPDRPRPVRVTLWRPPDRGVATVLPLVLLSHGTGGAAQEMAWLAEPLAEAGFLVAAVDHHGNNFVDGYLPQGFAFEWERPRDLSFVIDALTTDGWIGPIGAAGFSSGGYTAAALVGARLSAPILEALFAERIPVPEIREFPGLAEALRSAVSDAELAQAPVVGSADLADARISAAFLMCPASGQLVAPESLHRVARPVRVWWGDADTVTPPETNALVYRDAIPDATGSSAGPDVDHYHFAGDNPDGAATRERVAADAVAFFRSWLVLAI